jgi:hypothetical protein
LTFTVAALFASLTPSASIGKRCPTCLVFY